MDKSNPNGYRPTSTEDLTDERELISPMRRRARANSVDSMAGVDLRSIDFGGRAMTASACPCTRAKYTLFTDIDELETADAETKIDGVIPSTCGGRLIFCSKKFLKLPVFFFNVVIFADSTLLYGFNASVVYPHLPTFTVVLIAGLSYSLLLLYWSWYMVLFTPSSVEANPPPHGMSTRHLRRCGKCVTIRPSRPHLGLKPYRAHHCRVCDRCVLKMDHHCIFLAQCIGHFNYKYFCLFVVYAILACTFYVAVSIPASSLLGPVSYLEWYSIQAILTAISVLATFVLLVMLVIFWSTHIKLILNCQTTIEYIKAQSLDHGEPVLTKLRRVFGDEFWTWFFPIGRPSESGYEWDDPALTSRADRRINI